MSSMSCRREGGNEREGVTCWDLAGGHVHDAAGKRKKTGNERCSVAKEGTYSEVLNFVSNFVEYFVLAHAVWVMVAAEADHHEAVFFAEDGLVDVPACSKMRENDGAHDVV